MRALIVTDVHANAAALKAVLCSAEAKACDRVYSLGDEVNFGPQPRKVMRMLHEVDAQCLLGNHEDRLSRLDAPEFQGYNWAMLHWTAKQVQDERFDLLPKDLRLGPVLMTHGTPGDPWHLLHQPDVAAALDELPNDIRYLISGHNHTCWRVAHHGRLAVNPGSVGLLELEGTGGVAPFATVEIVGDDAEINTYRVPYNADETARAMIDNGCAAIAPEMTRAVMTTMRTGETMYVLRLMRHMAAYAQAHGLSNGDERAWHEADVSFAWHEPMTSPEYWKKVERDLHG